MKKRILIVDDEADIRELLQLFLQANGYLVTSVATAREAVDSVRSAVPDLLISDLQLEESDGLEMIGRLRKMSPNLPVLLLTSIIFDEKVVAESVSKLVSSYLPKTTPLNRVLAEVRRLVGDAG